MSKAGIIAGCLLILALLAIGLLTNIIMDKRDCLETVAEEYCESNNKEFDTVVLGMDDRAHFYCVSGRNFQDHYFTINEIRECSK